VTGRRSRHGNPSSNILRYEVEEPSLPKVRGHDQFATDPLQAVSSTAGTPKEVMLASCFASRGEMRHTRLK
jgi:hypothetical protein